MKKALHKITLVLALLFSATTLTSCGEDFWDDVSDSVWIEDNLLGSSISLPNTTTTAPTIAATRWISTQTV